MGLANREGEALIAGADRPASYPNGVTGKLCTWLAHLSLDDVPDVVRERAKYLLLDGIGCAMVGAKLPWSALAVETITRFEGAGNKTIIGWGRTTAGPAAALLNGTFIQGFELDDFHPLGPLHSASLIAVAYRVCRGAGRCERSRVPAGCDQRLRGWPARGYGAARRGDAVARLAFGFGLRHPCQCGRSRLDTESRRRGIRRRAGPCGHAVGRTHGGAV